MNLKFLTIFVCTCVILLGFFDFHVKAKFRFFITQKLAELQRVKVPI